MIKLFRKYILDNRFIVWFIIFALAMYFIYRPLLSEKTQYMDIRNISDYAYLFYVLLLPLAFCDMGVFESLVLDLLYISILSYVIISFVDFFFKKCSTVTLTRIKRKEWIKEIIKINLIYSLLVSIFYILFFLGLCVFNNIVYDLKLFHFIPTVYKILLTLIYPNFYLYFFLKSDSFPISVIGSGLIYILLEFVIRTSFVEEIAKFSNAGLIIIFFIVIYLCLIYLIKESFERRDIG